MTPRGRARCSAGADGEIAISTSSELPLGLPRTEAFGNADMSMANIAQQIHQTEGA